MAGKKFRVPRIWSNFELEKFAHLFSGKVVNVSGWKDIDKQGRLYKEYFSRADEYWITNYKSEARGFQGDQENEIFLDLSDPISEDFCGRFDVVFNHTVLEHIFEIETAFSNLCKMSRDIVIIVVPFLQEQHADYGDYWRLTPLAVDKLFHKNGLETLYLNYNDTKDASIYIFAIGSKNPLQWSEIKKQAGNKIGHVLDGGSFLGTKIIKDTFIETGLAKIKRLFR